MLAKMISSRITFEGASGSRELARRAGGFFSRLPYENLTKIVRHSRERHWRSKLRSPATVISDHLRLGTGGTCFSLTWALVALLRELGVCAWPALADRRNGPDGHCAVIVEEGGHLHLLDPGYLVTSPVRLDPSSTVVLRRPLNDLKITPDREGRTYQVSTVDGRGERWRYRLKALEVSLEELQQPWAGTFAGVSTRAFLVTRLAGGVQHYFHGRQFVTIGRHGRKTFEVPRECVPSFVASRFGICRSVADEARSCLSGS